MSGGTKRQCDRALPASGGLGLGISPGNARPSGVAALAHPLGFPARPLGLCPPSRQRRLKGGLRSGQLRLVIREWIRAAQGFEEWVPDKQLVADLRQGPRLIQGSVVD